MVGAAPAILDKALLMSTGSAQAFATIKGVDPALEPSVTDILPAMRQGSLDDLAPSDAPDASNAAMHNGILLGTDLAASLGVGVGDTIQILTPHGTLTPGGSQIYPRPVRVAGVFSIGLFEIDCTYGFISLDVAKRLLRQDRGRPDPAARWTTSSGRPRWRAASTTRWGRSTSPRTGRR